MALLQGVDSGFHNGVRTHQRDQENLELAICHFFLDSVGQRGSHDQAQHQRDKEMYFLQVFRGKGNECLLDSVVGRIVPSQ